MYLAALARRGRLDSTDSMTQNRIESVTDQPTVPPILLSWLAVFRPCFTAPVWNHILVLVGGAVLAPGKRTVTQALRVMGLADRPGFGRYHEALNRARWDARDVARRLLLHLLAVLSPSGEVVVGIDDTIETALGWEDQSAGHLSRPGTVVAWSLRQNQRPALAVAGSHAAGSVRTPALGAAVPHCAGALGSLERRARQAAQDPDRLGSSGDPADQALAARPLPDCRRRQQLRRVGTDRSRPPLCPLDHTTAP